jgi:hypothetical protein
MRLEFGILTQLLVLLLLSCASPFLERAHEAPGFSGGVGVYGVGSEIPGTDADGSNILTIVPVASARYCWDNGFSLSLVGGGGPSWTWMYSPPSLERDLGALATLGGKLPVGSHGALKLNLGAMGGPPWNIHSLLPVGNLSYLRDLSDLWTVSTSVGFPVFVGVGVSIHPRIGEHVVTHIALGTSTILSAGLGLGVDFVGSDQPEDQGRQHP